MSDPISHLSPTHPIMQALSVSKTKNESHTRYRQTLFHASSRAPEFAPPPIIKTFFPLGDPV